MIPCWPMILAALRGLPGMAAIANMPVCQAIFSFLGILMVGPTLHVFLLRTQGGSSPQGGSFALTPSVLASTLEERRSARNVKRVQLLSHRLSRFVQTCSIRARK